MTMGQVGMRDVRRNIQDASALCYRLFVLHESVLTANSRVRYSQGNHRTDSPVFFVNFLWKPDGRIKVTRWL